MLLSLRDVPAPVILGIYIVRVVQVCPEQVVDLDFTAIYSIAYPAPNCVFMATLPNWNRVILTTT